MFHFVLEKCDNIACFVTNNTKSKVTFEIHITNFERKMNDKYHENGIIMVTIKNRNEHI